MIILTFAQELDQPWCHCPQIFAHFFIGCEEHVRIVAQFPALNNVSNQGIVIRLSSAEKWRKLWKFSHETFHLHVVKPWHTRILDISANVNNLGIN